jgi:hypothetical protein
MVALEEAHKQGAFIFWNHPGWGVDEIKWHDVHETLYKNGWLHGIEVYNEFEWYPQALLWTQEKGLTLIGNTDVHDVTERLYDFESMAHRPMTLVLSKERTLEGVKEALFAKRTILYFYDMFMGTADLLKKLFEESVVVEKAHYEKEGRRFVTIKNVSDLPFQLKKAGNGAEGYPETIHIPAGAAVIVTLPNQTGQVPYTVENTITGVNEKLTVTLF